VPETKRHSRDARSPDLENGIAESRETLADSKIT
jgi:hypothetical protein